MKKTILCALAALAVSSCGEVPTEAVPADAVPVEGETLAGTEAEMQAAADGGNGVCEVEYDDDVTIASGSVRRLPQCHGDLLPGCGRPRQGLQLQGQGEGVGPLARRRGRGGGAAPARFPPKGVDGHG